MQALVGHVQAAIRTQQQTYLEKFVPKVEKFASDLPVDQCLEEMFDTLASDLPVRCPVARRAPDRLPSAY